MRSTSSPVINPSGERSFFPIWAVVWLFAGQRLLFWGSRPAWGCDGTGRASGTQDSVPPRQWQSQWHPGTNHWQGQWHPGRAKSVPLALPVLPSQGKSVPLAPPVQRQFSLRWSVELGPMCLQVRLFCRLTKGSARADETYPFFRGPKMACRCRAVGGVGLDRIRVSAETDRVSGQGRGSRAEKRSAFGLSPGD